MRVALAIFILAAATGGAGASSFVTPAPIEQTLSPSMILLGPPPAPVASAPVQDPELRPALPLASEQASAQARAPDELVPALVFPLGSLPEAPGRTTPRLAFPLGSLSTVAIVQLSPSVIAIGDPGVTGETVASVQPQAKPRKPQATPTVLRGGEVGGAFPSAASGAAAIDHTAPARVDSGEAQAQEDQAGSGETSQASAGSSESPSAPSPSPSAPAPEPAPKQPPPGMPTLRGPE